MAIWRCDKVYCGKPEIKGHGVVRAILLSRNINVNTKNCSWPALGGNVELVETEVMPSTPSLESAAHCCCNARTIKTTRPAVKCREGSKCAERT